MDSSFWIFVCLDGTVAINYKSKKYSFKKGETFLIPAILKTIHIEGYGEIIGITA